MRTVLFCTILTLTMACTEAPKDPRTAAGSAESSQAAVSTSADADVTSEQIMEALAKMDNSTVKVSGTAGGVRIETDGTSTKTIPAKRRQVGGMGIAKTITANGEHVVIDGSRNTVKIKGEVGLLEVQGDDHKVYVQSVDQIEIKGKGNMVYWTKKYNGKEPRLLGESSTESVRQAKFPE